MVQGGITHGLLSFLHPTRGCWSLMLRGRGTFGAGPGPITDLRTQDQRRRWGSGWRGRRGDCRPEAHCDEFLSGVSTLLPGSFPLNLLIGKAHQPLGGPGSPGAGAQAERTRCPAVSLASPASGRVARTFWPLAAVSESVKKQLCSRPSDSLGKPCIKGEGLGVLRPVLGEGKGGGNHLGPLSPGHGTKTA